MSEIRGIQKHFKLAMTSRWAAFSGNTSLIATFSCLFLFLSVFYWSERRDYLPNTKTAVLL